MNSQRKQMLQESIDYLKHDARMPSMVNAFSELMDDYEKLQSRIAELDKDAERYRWLRAQHNSDKSPIFVEKYDIGCGSMSLGYPEFDNDLDGAIDAAMQKD